MKLEYLEPASVAEAAAMLGNYRHRAKILAGGTDLVVQIRQGTLKPDFVIHIGRIEELNRITTDSDGGLFIGTLATMRAIERSERLAEHWDILRQGAAQVSCPQVRNVATLGGNSCNGIPSADTVPPLIALGAEAVIVGPGGERKVHMEAFHRGPGRTVLEADEFMRGFKIPAPPPCTGGCYLKYTPRGTSELAIVGVAALVTLNPKDGTCQDARIVLGACGPTPLRTKKAESLLRGNRLDAPLIEKAAHMAAEESRPNPGISVRAPASYRREMVRVWGWQALKNAWMKAEAYRSS
jgi:aerobic carbon-monoxide dehydrogenase medium subunit